jgi:hypothetical protein
MRQIVPPSRSLDRDYQPTTLDLPAGSVTVWER